MTKRMTEKPWTWKQIGNLKGPALAAFMEAYGERAQAARLVARGVLAKRGVQVMPPCTVAPWIDCPMLKTTWTHEGDPKFCEDAAPIVYARMIEALGRMPEGM